MSDDNTKTIENGTKTAEGLLEKGTFSLVDTIKGRTIATKDVTIATDIRAMHLRKVLEDEMNVLDNRVEGSKERAEVLEKEIAELEQVIKDSSLTFHLKGLLPHIVEETEDEVDAEIKKGVVEDTEEARNIRLSDAFMAKHISAVTRVADGAKDERVFEADDMATMRGYIPFEAWKKIRLAMDELTFAAAYFDASVSADFLSKS